MMEHFLVVGGEGNLKKVYLGRFRLHLKKRLSHSNGSIVVQEITPRESGSAHGFVFQGTGGEGGETSVKVWKC